MSKGITKTRLFLENRTSWRFFLRLGVHDITSRILLEILKEIQYLNDKGKK